MNRPVTERLKEPLVVVLMKLRTLPSTGVLEEKPAHKVYSVNLGTGRGTGQAPLRRSCEWRHDT